MWGDPRPNRMDPFRRSQEERFSSGWNRDFLSRSDGLGLERNSGGFQGGREPSRPFEMSGMLGPTGRSFPNREEPPFSFASRGGALTDFRAGERMALDFQARNLQARELSLLDLRAREAAEFRSREAHLMELRSREGLMMDYRARDGLNSDFRNRELLSLEFKERIAPHMDYREREILADLRSRELLPDFRGRGMLDMDFRSKEQPHADVRGMNISDNDFRNRNLPLSDFRSKEGPQMNFLGNTSTLDFRGKDGSQVDFRARDVPHSDFRAAGTSDLDFRGREETMFNFQSSERPRTDQDFRDKDRATGPVDFIERVRLPPNQPISDYTQSQPGVRIADEELHESRIDKTGDSDLVRPLYSQEHQTDNQGREGQSVVPPPVDVKNNDGPHTTVSPPEQTAEPTRQTSPTGEQRPQPGRGVKRGVDLDFLGRQDTDYRNMDYQDVDLRFDYGQGKSVVEERASKDAHQDNQMGKSGRSAAKSIKIGQATAPHARSDKDEHGARNSEEDFDGFVQRISSAVSAALDPKNAKVADVDQDYRPASGEESASRFIQIQGLPATADKEEIIEAFRAPDGNPIEDLQLSDYNPGGVISVRSPPKEVWICGHSLVQCAKERARRLPQGTQLGISCHKAKITWMGEVGMKWDQLIPTMKEMVGKPPAPDLIVVHLGENDLMQITGVDLIIRIKKDLRYLMALFPRAHIMWSSLLPRRVWLGAKKPAAIDRTRKEINREVKLFCRQAGMLQLQHDAIRFESPHQFSKDGEQLSEMGLEIFTADLQASIQGWLNVR